MNDVFKILSKFKNKFIKKKSNNQTNYDYAFSTEELESINKQNKQKILELKQNIFDNKKEVKEKVNTDDVLSKIEADIDIDNEVTGPIPIINEKEPQKEDILEDKKEEENSFVNLSLEHQKLVMDKWKEIKTNKIEKDIIDGKNLLKSNYTIYYADEAAKFIHYIRKEYEIVICYLIGFNNEKQGIKNKTIFSSKIDDEWKYLSNYIKILEKIRKNK